MNSDNRNKKYKYLKVLHYSIFGRALRYDRHSLLNDEPQ